MKRRAFIASTAVVPLAVSTTGPHIVTKTLADNNYAILCEYTLYRGGGLAFDLKGAARVAEDLGSPEVVALTVHYRDGRMISLDWRKLSRSSKSASEVRFGMIEAARHNLAIYDDPDQGWRSVGARNDERYAADWRRWISDGPTDEEVAEQLPYSDAKYLADEELDEIERGGFVSAAYEVG